MTAKEIQIARLTAEYNAAVEAHFVAYPQGNNASPEGMDQESLWQQLQALKASRTADEANTANDAAQAAANKAQLAALTAESEKGKCPVGLSQSMRQQIKSDEQA